MSGRGAGDRRGVRPASPGAALPTTLALLLAATLAVGCKSTAATASDGGSAGDGPGAFADAPRADAELVDGARLDASGSDAQGIDASGPDAQGIDAPVSVDAAIDAPAGPDLWKGIYDEVDATHLGQLVRELSGDVPVTVNGVTYAITERFSDAGRQRFRDYWTQSMTNLGLQVNVLTYQAAGHPRPGTNLEAVLPGPTADSFVVIVHYDSIGPPGHETTNPGADDDMTGMAIELETARILVAHQAQLGYTVRFVASDEEELGGLAGARSYATYIRALATTNGFAIVSAVDDEQTGWNCRAKNQCARPGTLAFDIFSCGSSTTHSFNFKALGDQFASVVHAYSSLRVVRACMGENSDHFAMWEIGVPTLVFSEDDPFDNPNFDQEGGDTVDKLDLDYHANIARAAIAFQAGQAGIPHFGM